MPPTLLLTRPLPQSQDFLAACEAAAGHPIPAVLAPLSEVLSLPAVLPQGDLILTSGRSVEVLGRLDGRRAWCVGDRTAELARRAGANAVSAGGNQDDLLALLLKHRPQPLVHPHGTHRRGGLREELAKGGLNVTELAVYQIRDLPLSKTAAQLLNGHDPVILPIFSPRSGAILAALQHSAPLSIIAISSPAAAAFAVRARVDVAAFPDSAAMVRAVLRRVGNLSLPADVATLGNTRGDDRRQGDEMARKAKSTSGTDHANPEDAVTSDPVEQPDPVTPASEPAPGAAPDVGLSAAEFDSISAEPVASAEPVPDLSSPHPEARYVPPVDDARHDPPGEHQAGSRRSILPSLIVGLVLLAAGFGTAWWIRHDSRSGLAEVTQRQQAILARLDKAEAAQAQATKAPDLSGDVTTLSQRLDSIEADLAKTVKAQSAMSAALDDLRQRPADTAGNDAAVAAYERELAAMREMFQKQLDDIRAAADSAAAAQTKAVAAGVDATTLAALSTIDTALDTGASFGVALDQLARVNADFPVQPLRPVADGVETLATLQSDFPGAARRAVNSAAGADGGSGFWGFAKAQMGVRSLTPRQGNSTDAILSRAEAKLRQGDLADALAETGSLTGPAAAAMADWRARAQARLAALAAFQTLSAKVRA